MSRLQSYLFRLFAIDAAALFGVSVSLMFLAQCLRLIDASGVRDQGAWPLLVQVTLLMPPISNVLLGISIAIGMGRVLRGLQANRELHIIHGSGLLGQLVGATVAFSVAGMVLVGVIAHLIEPQTTRQAALYRTQAAAELVGRSLVPHRFASLSKGVTVSVGGRSRNGEIRSFFADDLRDETTRRTYIAERATLAIDELGYVLRLEEGTIQYRTTTGNFSEIAFGRYDISLDRLIGDRDEGQPRRNETTIAIVTRALVGEMPNERELRALADRTAEALRVVMLGLFVMAVALFPSGQRRPPPVPIELAVLGAGIVERGIAGLAGASWFAPLTGLLLLTPIFAAIFVARVLPRRQIAAQAGTGVEVSA